jgi:hypothetical protein
MADSYPYGLRSHLAAGGEAAIMQGGWRLSIPAGPAGQYRLAQLDDYHTLSRGSFPHRPPLQLSLEYRASAVSLPGTWGFGLWNDPFSLSLGLGGGTRRFPALPNTAWFFNASSPNYLSLRDDLPSVGQLAATFHSPAPPSILLALAAPLLPVLLLPPLGRLARRLGRRMIRQAATELAPDPTGWHTFRLIWEAQQVIFWIDEQQVLATGVSPAGPLGLVLWIDNQYAALPPDGRLGYGTLANPQPAWIEVRRLEIAPLAG